MTNSTARLSLATWLAENAWALIIAAAGTIFVLGGYQDELHADTRAVAEHSATLTQMREALSRIETRQQANYQDELRRFDELERRLNNRRR